MPNISFLVGLCAVALLFYKYVLHPVFLSPLSSLPNAHFTSSFSPLWILNKRRIGGENRAIHAAHKRHGDIVRLGPNVVSVNCVDGGIRTIYSGGFEKSKWYSNLFYNYGVTNMFAMTDSKPHSIQKRMVSNVYSKSHLQSSPDLHKLSQILLFDRFLPILAAAASEQLPIDILELNFAATMDSMNAYIFGLSNGTDFLRDVDSRQHFLRRWHYRAPHKFWPQELPGITSLLAKIGIRMVPRSVDTANQEVEDWCLRMCKLAEKSSEEVATKRPPEETAYTPPVVYKQLSQSMTTASRKSSTSDSSSQGQDLFVASEILDQNIAGFETSGITLTYLYHELSQRPLLQSSLRTELLSLSPPVIHPSTSHALPSPRSIDALPLLHAILMETLRLHGAIPGPQPRVTPSTPTSLAGSKPLPGGVRVSAQPYSLHRNAEVFPDPESWIPERWLEADKERKDEMMRWFWAFGSGGRMCIGSNFAMQEMKLLTAAIYTNFTTRIIDDAGIEQVDAYSGGPKGNKLILQFSLAE